ncbi:MAG: gluconate 2-dehydrogenase subunit 3 family protein [Pseudomonadota bacterium]|nr:gluconate 2-dehydrogenase subunit 3 family protein [Pseudomonadota bacterium]
MPELPGFDRAQRLDFISIIDEIIPAADGMPAASEVDVDRYVATLFTQDQGLIEAFESGLDFLREKAAERYEQNFSNLDSDQRIELLEQLESTDPVSFRKVRGAVYEGYYTRPQIWHLVGYQPHPTNSEGPVMEPFEESSLERVRRSPKLYRDV